MQCKCMVTVLHCENLVVANCQRDSRHAVFCVLISESGSLNKDQHGLCAGSAAVTCSVRTDRILRRNTWNPLFQNVINVFNCTQVYSLFMVKYICSPYMNFISGWGAYTNIQIRSEAVQAGAGLQRNMLTRHLHTGPIHRATVMNGASTSSQE